MTQLEWDGDRLSGDCLALTVLTGVSETGGAPGLVAAAASTGDRRFLVRPDRVGGFLLEHREALFVCHEAGHFFWSVAEHLDRDRDRAALEVLWDLPRTGRLHDVVLLDQLLRVAAHGGHPLPRSLQELAVDQCEETPDGVRQPVHRGHGTGEVREEGPADVVRRADLVLDVYRRLRREADGVVGRSGIHAGVVERFGPLALGLQVQAAIAVRAANRDGLRITEESPRDVEIWWKEAHRRYSSTLYADPDARPCFKWEGRRIRLKVNGHLDVRESALRRWLGEVNATLLDVQGVPFRPPLAESGEVAVDPNLWADRACRHVQLDAWVRLAGAAAMRRSSSGDGPGGRLVRPRYVVVPRLRTINPNLELLGWVDRSAAFAAPEGYYFVVGKLFGLAVRCLAELCTRHLGASRLAGRLREGVDPTLDVATSWGGFLRLDYFVGIEADRPGAAELAMRRARAFVAILPRFWDGGAVRRPLRATSKARLRPDRAQDYLRMVSEEFFPEIGALLKDDRVAVRNPVGRVRGATPYRAQELAAACLDLCDDVTKTVLFACVDAGYTPVACAGEEFVVKVREGSHQRQSDPREVASQVAELAERVGSGILTNVPVRCDVSASELWRPGRSAATEVEDAGEG